MWMARFAAVGLYVSASWACNLVGPSCVDRQQRGAVTTVTGDARAGEIVSHRLRYETAGSQNDLRIEWEGRGPEGPRLRVYATRADCDAFVAPPRSDAGPCAVLASAGWFDDGTATTLVIANGRGNPDVLGQPPEYTLWVVADPDRSARYSISVTWFYGPDC
jgi:hypothetical protein